MGALAEALLAGDWAPGPMAERVTALVGETPRDLGPLVIRLVEALPERRGLTRERLEGWLLRDRGFRSAWSHELHAMRPLRRFVAVPELAPPRLPLRAAPPPLATVGDLAGWLGLSPSRLEGLADVRGWLRDAEAPLRNYRRWWAPSRRPGGAPRLIEAPKDRLRAVQRRIGRELLALAPPHPAAHGFVEGRSVWTAASVHAGESRLVRFDLRGFFPSIHRRRIVGIFEALGLPREVARRLGGLCTTRTPLDVLREGPGGTAALRDPHLPQGAPTSPALANLCAYRLDARLAGLARRRGAHYTRYADDLFLSGPRRLSVDRLVEAVTDIVRDEGFALQPDKLHVMGPGAAHRCLGLVVDRGPAVPRRDREQLEAILTNCDRHGAASQNRDGHPRWRAHLEGRVAWVDHVNPRHGAKLRALLDRIDWTG